MSDISDRCKNYGKHYDTAHYCICRRCEKDGLGCADYRTEGESYEDMIRRCSIAYRLYFPSNEEK